MTDNEEMLRMFRAAIQPLEAQLQAQVSELSSLNRKVGTVDEQLTGLSRKVSSLEDETKSMKRAVDSFESFPQPYGRPKTYHTATEFHSVSNPVRKKLGYQG
jgi:chromosome segregation ATPase